MTTIYAPNAAMEAAATKIAQAFTAGSGQRVALADGVTAFGWSTGLPRGLHSVVAHGVTESMSVPFRPYTPTGDPAPVAERAAKPILVASTGVTDHPLVKIPGLYEGTTEEFLYSAGAALAVYQILVSQILKGIDELVIDAITASAPVPTVAAASVAEAILTGQANVMANGGTPSFAVLNPADYVDLITDTAGGAGYLNFTDVDEGPQMAFAGLAICVSADQPAGDVLVGDGAAVMIVEHVASPVLIADPTYKLATNEVALAAEWFGVAGVVAPGALALTTTSLTADAPQVG